MARRREVSTDAFSKALLLAMWIALFSTVPYLKSSGQAIGANEKLYLSHVSGDLTQGGTLRIAVMINNTQNLYGVSFNLLFDASVLRYKRYDKTSSFLANSNVFNKSFANNNVSINQIKGGNVSGEQGSGRLLFIDFDVLQTKDNTTIRLYPAVLVRNKPLGFDQIAVQPLFISSQTTPPPTSCTLGTASFSKGEAAPGEAVTLRVNGSNCNGQSVNFTIKEHDSNNPEKRRT